MSIASQIRKELKQKGNRKTAEAEKRFFKEPIKSYGVKTPKARALASLYFTKVKKFQKQEIFSLCEELLKGKTNQESTIAFQWLNKIQLEKEDFETLEKWLGKYVDNWAKCDDFCCHSFGSLLFKFPELLLQMKKWHKSKNRWLKRASAVILILPVKKNKEFLPVIFQTVLVLLKDKDDMVQKGYGWLLKEASKKYQKEVFDFVMENKSKMPRTALRYAIEKMPQGMREEAMR